MKMTMKRIETSEITLKSMQVENLPRDVYRKLYSLNMRKEGCMREDLVSGRHKWFQSNVSMIFSRNVLLGWAILSNYNSGKNFDKDYFCIMVYVRKNSRRKGYAKILLNELCNQSGIPKEQISCRPWDSKGDKLFAKLPFQVQQ